MNDKPFNRENEQMNKNIENIENTHGSFLSRESSFPSSSSSFPSGKSLGGGLEEVLNGLSGVSLSQNFSSLYGGHWTDPIELDEEKFLLKKHSKIMTLISNQKVYSPKALLETFADELSFSSKTFYKVQRILSRRKMLNITHWEGLARRTFGMTLYFTNDTTAEDINDYMREYYNQDLLRYKKQLQREKTPEKIREETKNRTVAQVEGYDDAKIELASRRRAKLLCEHGYMPKFCNVNTTCKNSKWPTKRRYRN